LEEAHGEIDVAEGHVQLGSGCGGESAPVGLGGIGVELTLGEQAGPSYA